MTPRGGGYCYLLSQVPGVWDGSVEDSYAVRGRAEGAYSLLADSRKEARIPFCPQHLNEEVFDSWSLGGTSALHHDSLHFLPSLSQCLLTG